MYHHQPWQVVPTVYNKKKLLVFQPIKHHSGPLSYSGSTKNKANLLSNYQ